MKILVFGLPGTGKTSLSSLLLKTLDRNLHVVHLDAASNRKTLNDLDFSEEGRRRSLNRTINDASHYKGIGYVVIADIVCPLEKFRQKFKADVTVWMHTKIDCPYPDTTAIFEAPLSCDYEILDQNDIPRTVEQIANHVRDSLNDHT